MLSSTLRLINLTMSFSVVLKAIFEDKYIRAIEIELDQSFDFHDLCYHSSWSRTTDADDFYELALRADDLEAAKILVEDYFKENKPWGA